MRQLETQFKRNSNIELKKHQSGGKKAGKRARLVQTTPDTFVFLGTAPSINRKAPPLQLLRSRQSDEWALLLRTTFLLYCGDRGQTVAKLREELRRQTREKTGKLESKSTKRSKAPRSKKSAQQLYDHNLLNSSVI